MDIPRYDYRQTWDYDYFDIKTVDVYINNDILIKKVKIHPMVKINALYYALIEGGVEEC